MAMNIQHFDGLSVIEDGTTINVKLSRFAKQYKSAQYALDGAVMNSMIPFMPMETGSFINVTRAASSAVQGSGKVYAAKGPQGRFLYMGKGMVDEETGSPYARKGAKKVLVSQYNGKTNAKENLTYTTNKHPDAQAHWFDTAKNADGEKWVKTVKRIAGGGNGR